MTCSCSWLVWFFRGLAWYTLNTCESDKKSQSSKKHCLLACPRIHNYGVQCFILIFISFFPVDHDQNYVDIVTSSSMGGAEWIEDADSQQLHQLFPMWLREYRLGDGQAESGLENSELWERNWCTLGCLAGIWFLVGGLEHSLFFPYIGYNHPSWLSYFSEGLKPPTRFFLGQSWGI